jgi:anti-anti-sigma factor
MTNDKPTLEVYQTGELTVVGFGGQKILDQIDLSACRTDVVALVEKHKCKVLAFDMTGVKLVPSGMLGLLTSIRNLGVEVHIYNPSEDVQEVLEVTRLNTIMPVHHINVGARSPEESRAK